MTLPIKKNILINQKLKFMRHSKPKSALFFLYGFLLLFLASAAFMACNDKNKNPEPVTAPVVEEDHPCPPVNISELYKLELLKADVDFLKASSTPSGGLVFQFVYEKNQTNKMTMVAYATKPGRDFKPPTMKYLQTIQATAINFPDTVSLGDQFAKFQGGNGINQLISGSGHTADYYSLTFTPMVFQTAYNPSPGVTAYVKNIKYNICVKFKNAAGQFVENCGAAATDTHPSPPANY